MDNSFMVPDDILKLQCQYMKDADLYHFTQVFQRGYRVCKDILAQRMYMESKDPETKRRRRMARLRKFNPLWTLVQENPSKWWNYDLLSENPNITWDIVRNNYGDPSKRWSYDRLSLNPNITWDIVQANPTKGWDYYWLSANPNITWDIVKANPSKKWDYYELSQNPNITYDIIRNNPDPPGGQWDYRGLSQNTFGN